MNYYSFLAGFKIKRFFDWCGEQDLPVDDDNKDNHDKYHDGNNNDNNYEKYHADKDSKPDIPVDTCYPVYALRMPRFNRAWYTYDYDFECDMMVESHRALDYSIYLCTRLLQTREMRVQISMIHRT